MCSNWRLANSVNIILYLSISQKGYVNASLGSIIKFQHEHIWVIFQLIQGFTGFIWKIMNKQSYKQRNQLTLSHKGCGIYTCICCRDPNEMRGCIKSWNITAVKLFICKCFTSLLWPVIGNVHFKGRSSALVEVM